MTTYAEPEDLTERFPRDLTDPEVARLPILLEDASFWLGVRVPGLVSAIAADDEQAIQGAKLLVVAAVKRALLTQVPEVPGVQSITNTAGPFTQAVTYANPGDGLWWYNSELEWMCDLLRGSNRSGAVSMTSPGL